MRKDIRRICPRGRSPIGHGCCGKSQSPVWDVTKRILDPRLPISPCLIRVKTSQTSDVGRVIYANSITLTPGTISIALEDDEILVHALTREGAEGLAGGDMDRRAAAFEAMLLMFAVAALALLVAIGMAIARGYLGPTVYDRVLAGNVVGTLAVCTIAVHGFLNDRPEFLDIAIVYALLNVISTLAILKFFRFGSLGDPSDDESTAAGDEAGR